MPINLITVREVCSQYGLSDSTIRRHIRSGQLPAYRIGPRLIKLNPADVEAVLLRPAPTRRDAAADIESFIERTLAAAPPLTDHQRNRLAGLLRSVRSTRDSDESPAETVLGPRHSVDASGRTPGGAA